MPRETFTAGGVVMNAEGYILVVNQKRNSWSLPKGHIDPGEEAMDAAIREIYEESGITQLEYVKDLGRYQRYKIALIGGDDYSELKNIIMFLFRTPETDLKPVDGDNPEARWVSREDVAGLLTHAKDKEFFLNIRDALPDV